MSENAIKGKYIYSRMHGEGIFVAFFTSAVVVIQIVVKIL